MVSDLSDLYTAQSISGTSPIAIHNPNQNPVLVYLPQEFTPYQPVLTTQSHLDPTTQPQLAQTYFAPDANRITPPPFELLLDDYSTSKPKNYLGKIAALEIANI